MPGWHAATKLLQDDGEVQMVGIIQEQHPDRARLFMQWKEMGWPILVDSYDLLEMPYVPVTLAIDERGVIRRILSRPDPDTELGQAFLVDVFGDAAPSASRVGGARAPGAIDRGAVAAQPDLIELGRIARDEDAAGTWRAYGDALAVWGGPDRLGSAIEAYERATTLDGADGLAHFRLGVAYRARYDSPARQERDFQRAVDQWTAALDVDPNQYIWRRRIQQYGPRLDKPYPFYDWVRTAREDIVARGEEPATLVVEPRGSEFAEPAESFAASVEEVEDPDPRGRVLRDDGEFIDVEIVAVPPVVTAGGVARVHVVFRPIPERLAHWNNEAEDMLLWLDPPRGWEVDRRLVSHRVPPEAVSQETRTLEVEVRAPKRVRGQSVRIPGYALYYVCEDVDGICMYRRQDVALELAVRRPSGP